MKAIFSCSSGGMFVPQGEPGTKKFSRGNVSASYESPVKPVFVSLEIKVSALQRLIMEHRLVAEELHCMNRQSKDIVRKAILDTLIG